MVTVLRSSGLRIVIFLNDHRPAHVHVFGDGEAKINLLGAGGSPDLVAAENMNAGEVRRAMRLVSEHHVFLLRCWSDIHG